MYGYSLRQTCRGEYFFCGASCTHILGMMYNDSILAFIYGRDADENLPRYERCGEIWDILQQYGQEANVKGIGIMIISISLAVLFFAWLAIVLLGRLFPIYKKRSVRVIYGAAAVASLVLLYVSRFAEVGTFPEVMLKGSFHLLAAPFFVLVAVPLVYALMRAMHIRPSRPDASRRTFIKAGSVAIPALCYGVSGYGIFAKSSDLEVFRYAPVIKDLPAELAGMRIAQLSDTHLGVFVSLDKLDEMLRIIEAEKPDVLVITGDFIDGIGWTEEAVSRVDALARSLPYGAYFCWGNHEYLRDAPRIARALDASSIIVLKNASACVIEAERPLWFLGVDYPWVRNLMIGEQERERMIQEALQGVPNDAVTVLLAHHSDFIEQGTKYNIDLTLAGHTHGGQFAFGQTALLPVQYRYMRGFYNADGAMGNIRGGAKDAPTVVGDGSPMGYVNSGAGSWFPMRWGCPPEITILTLTRKEER